jgi:hypothetical protein
MSNLQNKKAVRDLALSLANGGRVRVASSFHEYIDAAIRTAVSQRVNHHDNKTGSRKTLV